MELVIEFELGFFRSLRERDANSDNDRLRRDAVSKQKFVYDVRMARCAQDRSKFLGSYNYTYLSCTLKVPRKDIRVRSERLPGE